MKDLEKIIGKKAYWGSHMFEASLDESTGKVKIKVFRAFPSHSPHYETSYVFSSKEEIAKASADEALSLGFFTGNLTYKNKKEIKVQRKLKTGRTVEEKKSVSLPAIDLFIEAFHHAL